MLRKSLNPSVRVSQLGLRAPHSPPVYLFTKRMATSRSLRLVVLTLFFTLVDAQRWVRLAREADFTNELTIVSG